MSTKDLWTAFHRLFLVILNVVTCVKTCQNITINSIIMCLSKPDSDNVFQGAEGLHSDATTPAYLYQILHKVGQAPLFNLNLIKCAEFSSKTVKSTRNHNNFPPFLEALLFSATDSLFHWVNGIAVFRPSKSEREKFLWYLPVFLWTFSLVLWYFYRPQTKFGAR